MARFAYSGTDRNGQPVRGVVTATDEQAARELPEIQNIVLLSLRESTDEDSGTAEASKIFSTPTESDGAELLDHLSRLAESDPKVIGGLRALVEELPSGHDRGQLSRLVEWLERDSKRNSDGDFPELPQRLAAVLRCLPVVRFPVDLIGLYIARSRILSTLQKRIGLILVYPALLATAAFACGCFLLVCVVPGFSEMYEEFGIELPWLTSILLGLSDWFVDDWGLIVAVSIGTLAMVWFVIRGVIDPATRSRCLWRIPLFGKIVRDGMYADFSSALSAYVRSELPLDRALELAGQTVSDAAIRDASGWMVEALRSGQSLMDAKTSLPGFPLRLLDLFQSDLDGHSFADSLQEMAAMYEAQVSLRTHLINLFLQPLLVIIIGVFVFLTVVSLFMPLVSLLSALA